MNRVILLGRLTRDPEVRYSQGENQIAIGRYTLAVDRGRKDNDGNSQADFISCVALGKNGEFAEKYLRKGTKIAIEGHIQTGSFTNKDGIRVYTTDIVVEHQEFAESKGSNEERNAYYDSMAAGGQNSASAADDGFMNIPDGIDEELPFN